MDTTEKRPDPREDRLKVKEMRRDRATYRRVLRRFFTTDKGQAFLKKLDQSAGEQVAESVRRLVVGKVSLGKLLEAVVDPNQEKRSWEDINNDVLLKVNALDLMDYYEATEVDEDRDVAFVFISQYAEEDQVNNLVDQIKTFMAGTELLATPKDIDAPDGFIEVDPEQVRFYIIVVSENPVEIPKVDAPKKPKKIVGVEVDETPPAPKTSDNVPVSGTVEVT